MNRGARQMNLADYMQFVRPKVYFEKCTWLKKGDA